MHLLSVFSLRNRALIALITIVIAVFGGVALTSLKQELIPSISLPSVDQAVTRSTWRDHFTDITSMQGFLASM